MTAREVYLHILTEINKVGAPTLLLDDFIYAFNKVVQQYSNKAYNKFEINQQATDDLGFLKTQATIPIKSGDTSLGYPRFYCELPADYMHLLTCFVQFEATGEKPTTDQCGTEDEDDGYLYSPARRLTSDQETNIMKNAYFKPSYERPYYIIRHINDTNSEFPKANEELKPTNSLMDSLIKSLNGTDRVAGGRQSNVTPVIMEIKCGKTTKYTPKSVRVDYIKSPMKIVLTHAQLDGVDTSQVLEFPDYVCYEIINDLTKFVLENSSDARLQTNAAINTSIGSAVTSADKDK